MLRKERNRPITLDDLPVGKPLADMEKAMAGGGFIGSVDRPMKHVLADTGKGDIDGAATEPEKA